MAASPPDPEALLRQARAARLDGNYLQQLHAARRSAVVPGAHREAALLEALEALVFLARYPESRALITALGQVGGVRTRIRVAAWHSYVEVLEGKPEAARARLAGIDELLAEHGQPHDVFLVEVSRSRVEQAADRPVQAIDHAERALDLAPAAGGESRVMAHRHLGYLWLDLGLYDRATEAFENGLALPNVPHARRAALHMGACVAQRKAGHARSAVRHGEQAVALHFSGQRAYREGEARLALAEALLSAGRRSEALAEARRAIERVQIGQSMVKEMEGRLCLAKILRHEGLHDAVRVELRRVLASAVPQLHDEALVALAELADGPQDPHLAQVKQRYDDLVPALQARVAWVLARQATEAGRNEESLTWFEHYGQAREEASALEARRRYRVLELRVQVKALREERERAAELAHALRAQERLREAAEGAEAERRDLMELVAHDLRNPLSALLLMLDSVDEAEDVAEVRELVTLGRRSAQAMRAVLDEALTASGSIGELGETESVDLHDVVRGSIDTFAAGARAKGQTLKLGSLPNVRVQGVPGLLRSVLDNLLSNALKFTPRGGTVRVGTTLQRGVVVVTVTDDGPGLPPGEAQGLFERRVKGSARPTEGEGSTGLGLYLVRKVVEGHGGKVSASSPGPGWGATFAVTLPVLPARP